MNSLKYVSFKDKFLYFLEDIDFNVEFRTYFFTTESSSTGTIFFAFFLKDRIISMFFMFFANDVLLSLFTFLNDLELVPISFRC